MTLRTWLSLALTSLLAAGCGAKATDPSGNGAAEQVGEAGPPGTTPEAGPGTTLHTPVGHRPSPVVCAMNPASKPFPSPLGVDAGPLSTDGTCTTDAECGNNDGWPGFCRAYPGVAAKQCNYDSCFADSDCGATGVCSCEGTTRGYAGGSPGNKCVPSNCRQDSDCGTGPRAFCSPTLSPDCGSFYGTQGWYCHTASDECSDDADCGDAGPGFAGNHCSYRPEVGHWTCESGVCAG